MLELYIFIESIFWGSIMKVGNFALLLFVGAAASIAFAQASPPTEPPVLPSAPTAPTTAEPAGVSQPKIAEGVLFKSQRLKNDKGTNNFICTYRVAGIKRDVQLEESCPATMVFQLKK